MARKSAIAKVTEINKHTPAILNTLTDNSKGMDLMKAAKINGLKYDVNSKFLYTMASNCSKDVAQSLEVANWSGTERSERWLQ